MIGLDQNSNIGQRTQFQPGISGNPNGRPKGRKSLKTIILELAEDPEFNWELVPIKNKEAAKAIGSPWKVIVYTAIAKAVSGDVKAMQWLNQAAYGNKVDIVTVEDEIHRPLILPEIKKRNLH